MFFNVSQIGDWLGKKLSAKAEDLTDEDLQKMKKDDLIAAVKELQTKYQKLQYQHGRLYDKIFDIFMKA